MRSLSGLARSITVELAQGLPGKVSVQQLATVPGCTVRKALMDAGWTAEQITAIPIGLNGQRQVLDTLLQDGDRIELYEALPPGRGRGTKTKQNESDT